MEANSALIARERSQARSAILSGGLMAGALDITAAFISNKPRGVSPVRVLQSVASGLLDASAFKGGAQAAALGLALHFFIALTAATVYYAASCKLPLLLRQPILSGALYGALVYFFMYFVVAPLSAAPFKLSHAPTAVITNLLIHIFCVGLPIALALRWRSKWIFTPERLPSERLDQSAKKRRTPIEL